MFIVEPEPEKIKNTRIIQRNLRKWVSDPRVKNECDIVECIRFSGGNIERRDTWH